jgi:hypothetical protein
VLASERASAADSVFDVLASKRASAMGFKSGVQPSELSAVGSVIGVLASKRAS